jgi:endogenous inhibitor of DNA gyrase (YacG/DUF329 family)
MEKTTAVKTVRCPVCDSPVKWSGNQRWRPFCSERCKLIDLGTWFDESNRIPGDRVTSPNPEDS